MPSILLNNSHPLKYNNVGYGQIMSFTELLKSFFQCIQFSFVEFEAKDTKLGLVR